jgi:hypothetical protein
MGLTAVLVLYGRPHGRQTPFPVFLSAPHFFNMAMKGAFICFFFWNTAVCKLFLIKQSVKKSNSP